MRLFVTGTDTDVGKTCVSVALLEAWRQHGRSTAALKPVAAGAQLESGQLQNVDAILLQRSVTARQLYEEVNPLVFAQPIAPHIAAQEEGVEITVQQCLQACKPALNREVDLLLVEGAGGWLVPLNNTETMADLAQAMRAQVILVVGMRLGCISHALLTAAAIESSGMALVGWVANHIEADMPYASAVLAAIERRINAPLLGVVPYMAQRGDVEQSMDREENGLRQPQMASMASHLDISSLL